MDKKLIGVIIGIVILLLLGFGYLAWVKNFLPFRPDRYGVSFNPERVKLKQPIIEPYFKPKFKTGGTDQSWYTPDSIKPTTFHIGKSYATNFGKISTEIDYFQIHIDSMDIIKMDPDTAVYDVVNDHLKINSAARHILERDYFYDKDSVGYQVNLYIEARKLLQKNLIKKQGDSILNAPRKK